MGAYTGQKGECREQDGEVKDERKRVDNCPLLIGYVLIKSVENGYNTVDSSDLSLVNIQGHFYTNIHKN